MRGESQTWRMVGLHFLIHAQSLGHLPIASGEIDE